jgi:hypothetical protein
MAKKTVKSNPKQTSLVAKKASPKNIQKPIHRK